jgi:hypothetical protein
MVDWHETRRRSWDSHQFLYFYSPLKLSFYLFYLSSSLIIIIILLFTLVVAFAQNSTLQVVCACKLRSHVLYSKQYPPPKGILIIKGFIWKLPFCKVLVKQASKGCKSKYPCSISSPTWCVFVFLNP